jgi:predicted TIM-barrel fold metal-dependent hydrolase
MSAPARQDHPRYRGPVVDVHVHYDASSRARALAVNRLSGIESAVQLWDVRWPPARFTDDLAGWQALEPGLLRCHVPDLSAIGTPGSGRRLERELRTAHAYGCVGVKVWKNLGLVLRDAGGRRVTVDDARLAPLWETAAELALPVLIHVGDPPQMWEPLTEDNPRYGDLIRNPEWWYGRGGFPALAQIHEEFERLVAGRAATTFVGAHFGCFLSAAELHRWFGAYPNFHVDTAAAVSEIGYGDVTAARRLFIAWPGRILFGTDLARTARFEYPDFGARRWDLAEYFARHWRFFETAEGDLPHPIPEQVPWTVTGIDLPDDVLRALYHDNAKRLYRIPAGADDAPAMTAVREPRH